MKNLKYLVIVLSLIFVIGCQNNDDLPPAFEDATWVTSIAPGNEYSILEGEHITFRDLSQNPLTHEFTIEEGNRYLQAPFDVGSESLQPFINRELGLINTDKDAHVLFLKPGINKVKLRNTFQDSIIYRGRDTIYPFKENGIWVIENEWEVDVFGKLKPAFKVLDKNGDEIISVTGDEEVEDPEGEIPSSWPVIDVEAGDGLTFVDLTTEDRPTSRSWSLPFSKLTGGASVADENLTANYFSLGKFTAGSMKSIRGDLLPAENVVKFIPLVINVIPSSQPFEIVSEIQIDSEGVISFTVSGEVAITNGSESDFTVNVQNPNTGFDQDIPVSSVTTNINDKTIIELKLAEAVYFDDEITLSYMGDIIESVDTRILNNIDTQSVVRLVTGESVVDPIWAGAESESMNNNGANANGYWVGNNNGTVDDPIFTRTTDMAFSGDASMRYSYADGAVDRNLQGWGIGPDNLFKGAVPAGSYYVSYMIYIEPGTTLKGFRTAVTQPWTLTSWNIENIPRGVWVEIGEEITLSSDSNQRFDLNVRPDLNSGVTGRQTFYLDDMKWRPINYRP
ncbi:hypothetical protein [Flavivirga algicola]|uniref:Uncharacterized protein n=1 Tax=Flavivirga algicola TaxID=2729136 RepID=A0ABX1RTI1_9FLAO|nr:hypothetical protein [Flavivirga algicola]NMH86864.1 hypothetical protein [Flavivirga algicola]